MRDGYTCVYIYMYHMHVYLYIFVYTYMPFGTRETLNEGFKEGVSGSFNRLASGGPGQ